MRVVDAGHQYELDTFDGAGTVSLRFMKRVGDGYPGNESPAYSGTNCQEVIRALIDRVKYLHSQIPHSQNGVVINALRNALLAFEVRAAERHGRFLDLKATIEHEPTCDCCGHIQCEHLTWPHINTDGDAV